MMFHDASTPRPCSTTHETKTVGGGQLMARALPVCVLHGVPGDAVPSIVHTSSMLGLLWKGVRLSELIAVIRELIVSRPPDADRADRTKRVRSATPRCDNFYTCIHYFFGRPGKSSPRKKSRPGTGRCGGVIGRYIVIRDPSYSACMMWLFPVRWCSFF